MMTKSEYLDFIKSKGRPLVEINPGSDEVALSVDIVLQAIELLKNNQVPVLGGDILSVDDLGKLIYAYQLWGSEYHCLNWYCDKTDNESPSEYCDRSYKIAQKSIQEAAKVSKRLGKECYIVLVI